MIHAQLAVADIFRVEGHYVWDGGFVAPAQIGPISVVVKLVHKKGIE